jgi:hypothetical protein
MPTPVRESRWDIRGALTSIPTHSEPFQGPVQRRNLKSGVYWLTKKKLSKNVGSAEPVLSMFVLVLPKFAASTFCSSTSSELAMADRSGAVNCP